jgi:hypothetical protein
MIIPIKETKTIAMTKTVFLFSLFSISITAFSQTKTIAFKRHSGNLSHFSKSLSAENLYGGPSNLGVAPEKWVRNSELKRVIFINDTAAVMVTDETCKNIYSYEQRETDKWKAGADTVLRHPVFSADISVDSMRAILTAEYYFANDMKEVIFENFENRDTLPTENKLVQENKEKHLARTVNKKQRNSTGKYTWFILILASSAGIGLIKLR